MEMNDRELLELKKLASRLIPDGVKFDGKKLKPLIKHANGPVWICTGITSSIGLSPKQAYEQWLIHCAAIDHASLFSPSMIFLARQAAKRPWYKRIFR